jgi:hypothetical protein
MLVGNVVVCQIICYRFHVLILRYLIIEKLKKEAERRLFCGPESAAEDVLILRTVPSKTLRQGRTQSWKRDMKFRNRLKK